MSKHTKSIQSIKSTPNADESGTYPRSAFAAAPEPDTHPRLRVDDVVGIVDDPHASTLTGLCDEVRVGLGTLSELASQCALEQTPMAELISSLERKATAAGRLCAIADDIAADAADAPASETGDILGDASAKVLELTTWLADIADVGLVSEDVVAGLRLINGIRLDIAEVRRTIRGQR